MIDIYWFFVDLGAGTVVNHHHCYIGYNVYKGKPIFMDWAISVLKRPLVIIDGRAVLWSAFIYVKAMRSSLTLFHTANVRKLQMKESSTKRGKMIFSEKLNGYNTIISDDEKREEEYIKWCRQKKEMYKVVFNIVNKRYVA